MLYFCGKAFTTVCGCCCKDDTSTHSELLEVTYEEALLARHAQTGCGNAAGGGVAAAGSRPQSTCTKPGVALAGVATYRLPHHPKYSEIFSNPLYKPVWFKAFGRLRYTTLVGGYCEKAQGCMCFHICCRASVSWRAADVVQHCVALFHAQPRPSS
jgi:hypothetical protein